MPYEIRKKDSEYCVYKESGGEALGCHATRQKAQKQIAAIEASEATAALGIRAKHGFRSAWRDLL